ncbi:MAG: fatty acid-binding protein DegV, partial [Lachnospiraceae bacterium]|nr:fatty acid-binding protein DegV [Lachnospiraceae bacterium]
MREWLQKLNDPARDPYERRYRLFSLLGITLIALWTAVVSFVDYNPLRFVFLAGILLVYIPTMIITLKTGRIQIGAGLSAIIAVYIMTPFLFFYDGGITAGVFNYAAASLVFIMMTMSGRFRTVMIVSDVVVIIACFALSYHYPTWVNPLGREASYVDAAISLLATLVVTGTAILFQLYMFRQERDILKEQQNKVADLNRSQNNFFSSMSHEIRTPINTIIGMNELILRDKTVSKEIAQDAEAIQGASRMLLALINDILDMSKIESGNMDIVEVTYDVSQLLLEVVGMIRDRAKEKGLAFNLDVDPSIPVMLCGDELRIKQVLVNL